MRILYDHQVFSLQDAGGASRYHFELIQSLQKSPDISIEALLGLNNSVLPFPTLRQANTLILSRRTAIQPGLTRYAANELYSALVTPLQGRFDIYHPTLYRALPWVRRERIVVTHHDCIHERFPQLFSDAASIIKTKRKLFRQADAIICVSASSRADLLHFYDGLEEKSHVVHHGFSPLPPPSDKGNATMSHAPYLLYVGSRAGYKNFALLLEAFSRSGLAGKYHLVAVGGGPLTAKEEQSVAAFQLGASVTVIPKAGEELLAQAYRGAALFIYPSLYEGFGFPPLEAMSLDCPVLVNRTSSLPEICGDAAFYFESDDPGELSRSLVAVLENPEEMARKRALGREQIKHYDWRRTAERTMGVYRSVFEG
jgi:glycosyltransferase involved in cell wall biosynthesis